MKPTSTKLKGLCLLLLLLFPHFKATGNPNESTESKEKPIQFDTAFEFDKPEEFKKNSPASLRAQALNEQASGASSLIKTKSVGGSLAKTTINLGFEAAMFYSAAGLVAMRQLYTDSASNPAALENWWSKNATDPASLLGFVLFAGGNRSTHWLLAAMNADQATKSGQARWQRQKLEKDPEARAKYLATGKLPRPPNSSVAMKTIGALHMPLGLTGGLLFSSLVTELLNDKDLYRCTRAWIRSDLSIGDTNKANDSCEAAYDNWSRRHRELYPEMLSMLASAGIQAAVMKSPAAIKYLSQFGGKGRAAPLALRYFRITLQIAGRGAEAITATTPGGWLVFIGSTYLFLELDHLIGPPLLRWWNVHDKGQQLTLLQTRIEQDSRQLIANKYIETPTVSEPSDSSRWSMDRRLRDFTRLYQKHRAFMLQQVYETNSSWTSYVTQFVQTYTGAYTLNLYLLGDISERNAATQDLKNSSTSDVVKKSGELTLTLHDDLPFSIDQLPTLVELEILNSQLIVWLADQYPNGFRLTAGEQEILRKVQIQIGKILASQNLLEDSAGFRRVIEELRENLQLRQRSSRLLKTNHPLVATFSALKKPKPTRKGWAFLQQLPVFRSADSSQEGSSFLSEAMGIFGIESKASDPIGHPAKLGKTAQTSAFLDYLIASMVCGPELNTTNSSKEKTQIKFPQMFSERSGIGISFIPPRVLQKTDIEFCNQVPNAGRVHTFSEPNSGVGLSLPTVNVHDGNWRVHGKIYEGFLALVSNFAKPELTKIETQDSDEDSRGTYSFVTWWNEQVVPDVQIQVKKLTKQFETFLLGKYLPALTSTEVKVFNEREFPIGVLPALITEADAYFQILSQAYNDDIKSTSSPEKLEASEAALKTMTELQTIMEAYARLFYTPEVRLHAFVVINNFEIANGDAPLVASMIGLNPTNFNNIKNAKISKAFTAAKAQMDKRIQVLLKYEQGNAKTQFHAADHDSHPDDASKEQQARHNAVLDRIGLRVQLNRQVLKNLQGLIEELAGYRAILNSASPSGMDALGETNEAK